MRSAIACGAFLVLLVWPVFAQQAAQPYEVPQPPYAQQLDGQNWYSVKVFRGRLIGDALISGSAGSRRITVLSDDRLISSYSASGALVWRYQLSRRALRPLQSDGYGNWEVQLSDGSIELIDGASGALIYRRRVPDSSAESELLRLRLDSREVEVASDGSIRLTSAAPSSQRSSLSWKAPFAPLVGALVNQENQLILYSRQRIAVCTPDGVVLNSMHADVAIESVYQLGDVVVVLGSQGQYRQYDAGLHLLSRGQYDGPGTFYAELPAQSGGRVMLAYDSATIYISYESTGGEPQRQTILAMEDQWHLSSLVFRKGLLLAADSAWRLHSIDVQQLCRDLWNINIENFSANPVSFEGWRFYLRFLENSLDDVRELERQLGAMEQQISSFSALTGGRLSQYQGALSAFIPQMYRSSQAGQYEVANPLVRGRFLVCALRLGGADLSNVVFEALSNESDSLVYSAVLQEATGTPSSADLRLLRRLESYILSAQDWQLSDQLIDSSYAYCMSFFEQRDLDISGPEIRELALSILELLYPHLDSADRRRSILGRTRE